MYTSLYTALVYQHFINKALKRNDFIVLKGNSGAITNKIKKFKIKKFNIL